MKERKEELDNVKQKLRILKSNLSDVEAPKKKGAAINKNVPISKPSTSMRRIDVVSSQ